MEEQILKELRIQNLLSVISILCEANGRLQDTKTSKVLHYIYDREMSDLQFDIALFPKKTETKDYKFHDMK